MRHAISVAATIAVTVAIFLASAQPAAAHERRTVGPYQLVVGWSEEPSFVGQPNAVSLRVSDTRVTPAKPVEGVEKTLSAEVFQGGATRGFAVTLRAVFGQPGLYAGDVFPTREGAYRFVFKGKIETLDVNEQFESGPGRFDEVRPLAAVQYPDQVPSGADLGRRLADLQSTADQTRLIAIAGTILAALALGLLFVRRRV